MRQERCAVSLGKGSAASRRELAGAPAVVVVAPLCSGSSGAKRRLSPGVPEQGASGATRRESVHLIWGMVSPLCSGPPGARRRARVQLDCICRRHRRAALFREFRSKAPPCSGSPGARRSFPGLVLGMPSFNTHVSHSLG